MEQPLIQQDIFPWTLGLVLGLPLLLVVLGEVVERLRQNDNPLAEGLLRLRHYALPLLALFLLMRQVLDVSSATNSLRLVESGFWIAIIFVGLTLLGNLTRIRITQPSAWIANVPGLFFAVGRAMLVLFVVYYVLSGIWQVDVSNLFTAVGIGALAISFALQDTLSNLVSGFLLLVDRPFQPGDYVQIDEVEIGGEEGFLIVEEVNWRAVRFRSHANWAVKIIPNGVLGGASITNFGKKEMPHKVRSFMGFAFEDPPNLAKQVLLDILENESGILTDPKPNVIVWEYADSSIVYRLEYFVEFAKRDLIADRIKTQIFYAARRNNLTIPFPVGIEYNLNDMLRLAPTHDVDAMLRDIPLLQKLPEEEIQILTHKTRVHSYGNGERILVAGKSDEGFYLIHSGSVRMTATDPTGQEQIIAHLTQYDFFGAIDILRPGQPRQTSATAVSDVKVLIAEDEIVRGLIERYPSFAMELHYFVEERAKAVDALNRNNYTVYAHASAA